MRSWPILLVVSASSSILFAVTGCDHWLARNNPCGGFYPQDGVAEIYGVKVDGDVEVDSASGVDTRAFTSDLTVLAGCSLSVVGLASEDGSDTMDFVVECPDVTVSFTIPDVRLLAEGARISVPASAKLVDGTECISGAEGMLAIEGAAGAKAPAPSFVTTDFLRSGTIDLDAPGPAPEDAGTDGAAGAACPSRVALHARMELVASNYTQAMQQGEDHCPAIPISK